MRTRIWLTGGLTAVALLVGDPAFAGPPFVLDDPEPTDIGHGEVYAFGNGTDMRDGNSGEAGLDFNYGGAPDLQFTAVFPIGYDLPAAGPFATGLGSIELAVKYRFLHQDNAGLDVAVFPRLFLPSSSPAVGERHVSFFLPLWLEKDWGMWSAFGGGGCELDRGGGSQDFCIAGAVLNREVLPNLRLGAELFHQTAGTTGGSDNTSIGAGAAYDISENYHLLGYVNTGIQNHAATNRYSWYAAMLFTF